MTQELDKIIKLIEISKFLLDKALGYRRIVNEANFSTSDVEASFVNITKVYTQYTADIENVIIAEVGKILPKNTVASQNLNRPDVGTVIPFPEK